MMSDPVKESAEQVDPREEGGNRLRETMGEPEERSGSSRRQLLLFLLLLVVAGGGLFFYFGESDPQVAVSPPAATSMPIVMPVPAPPERAAGVGSGVEAVAPKSAEPASPPDMVAAPPSAPTTAPPPAPVKKTAFALETEPILLPARLAEAERTLRTLGYEPSRTPVEQTALLTRLRLGIYPFAEAQTRLNEARALIPSAFPLRQGDDVAIYAGSFLDLDRARIYADELYEQGIRVEEEQAQVSLNVHKLRFGAFSGEEEAAAAATLLRKSGLESQAVRLP